MLASGSCAVYELGGDARHVAGQRPALGDPLRPAAVHDERLGVAVVPEQPEAVGGVPVVAVAVEDHGGVVRDAPARHQRLEAGLVDEVALERVLDVDVPVELDGAGDVALLVEQDVLVGLHEPKARVVQMLGDPVRVDEYLGVRIAARGHRSPSCFRQIQAPRDTGASARGRPGSPPHDGNHNKLDREPQETGGAVPLLLRLLACWSARGSQKVNVVPRPSPGLSAQISPAVPLHDLPADVEPEPEPLNVAVGRVRRPPERLEDRLGAPGWQADALVAHGDSRAGLVVARPTRRSSPPSGVYFTALLRRFASTCSSRAASAWTISGPSASHDRPWLPALATRNSLLVSSVTRCCPSR